MTSAELIRLVGPALFGRNWQSELADWLGMNRRTIRRWMSGEDEPRPVVWTELLEITRERHTQLAALIETIARAGKGLDMNAERVSFNRDGERYLVYLGAERVGLLPIEKGFGIGPRVTWCSLVIGEPAMMRRARV